MATVKTGWLEKQGSGLFWKSWKRKYCVLYGDGELSVYDSPTDAKAELRIQMQSDVKRLVSGFACGKDVSLPKSQSSMEALFNIETRSESHFFCAESDSECRSWVAVLEQARAGPSMSKETMGAPPPYAPATSQQPVYSQPVGGGTGPGSGPPSGYYPSPPQGAYMPPGYAPPVYGQPVYGGPVYGQPMYGQPMYGQPMYGQPVYVSQQPQQQPQQRDNGTRNMLLAGGGGLLGGYMLGSMMSHGFHHDYGHHDYGHGGYGGHGDYGGYGSSFDGGGGGFEGGGGFGGGDF